MKPLIDKSDFAGLDRCVWLYCGAESPPHRSVMTALQDYVTSRSKGPEGRMLNQQIEESCRRRLAAMMDGKPEHIALISNASEAINNIARMIPFRPGDNVIITDIEFPSGVLPWLQFQDQRIAVRVVPHHHWQISVEDIMEQVDENTRLVVVSHVSFMTGSRLDYKRLYEKLKQTETLLLVDVTQSLGVVPVSLQYADFMVSSSYKWLLSVHGAGILAVNPERTRALMPSSIGWRSVEDLFRADRFHAYDFHSDARKFELGYPSYPTLYVLNEMTKLLLDIGIENIEQHVLDLGSELISALQSLGCELMTPEQADRRAGNISIVCENGEEIADRLAEKGIYVWGGDGRLRMSVHAFNDQTDVLKLTQALRELQQTGVIRL